MRVLVLAVLLLSIDAALAAEGAHLISLEQNPSQSAQSRAKAWGDIPKEKRERIQDYLRVKLGLCKRPAITV